MYRERFHRRFQPIVRRLADASNPVEFAVAYVAVMPSMLFITPLAFLAAVEATVEGVGRLVNGSASASPYDGWFTSRHRVLGYWFGLGAIVSMWVRIAGVAVPWGVTAGCLAATLACLGPTLSTSTADDSDTDSDRPDELTSIRRRYAEGELTDAEMEAELDDYWAGEILGEETNDDGDENGVPALVGGGAVEAVVPLGTVSTGEANRMLSSSADSCSRCGQTTAGGGLCSDCLADAETH